MATYGGMTPKKGLLVLALMLPITGGVMYWHYTRGAKQGFPCKKASNCSRLFGAACVMDGAENYCSNTCDSNADCDHGWTCGTAYAHRKRVTKDRQVCVRP
jgi:hypothetical protein